MAKYRVIYWNHIPSMVQVEAEGRVVRAQLSQRFQIAIDQYAMNHGLTGTDEYVAGWRCGEWVECPGSADDVAQDVVLQLERQYGTKKLTLPVDILDTGHAMEQHT